MTIIANKSIITKIKYKNKLTYIEPVNYMDVILMKMYL